MESTQNSAFTVNTNDLKTVKLAILINQDSDPLDLTDATVRLAVKKPDQKSVLQDATIIDAVSGSCEIILDTQAYVIPGTYTAEIMVYYGTDTVAVTSSFTYKATRGIMNDDSIESTNEWQSINQAIADAEGILIDLRDNGTGVDAEARADITTLETSLAEKATQIEAKADKTYVDTQVQAVASGSPKGTYATLTALQTAFPTGNTNIYLVTADGKWYYWNGSAWTAGGVYQATGLSPSSVLRDHVEDLVLSMYPFQPRATFVDGAGFYRTGIKGSVNFLEIYGADPSKKYSITSLYRANGANSQYLIEVSEVTDSAIVKVVCQFNMNGYTELGGVEKHYLLEANASGISGVAYMDWSKITLGHGYWGMFYTKTGLDKRVCSNIRAGVPFSQNATAFGILRDVFSRIDLFGADSNEKYYISETKRNFFYSPNSTYLHVIRIKRKSDNAIVCELNDITSNIDESVTYVDLTAYSNSGIRARVWLNWANIPSGSSTLYTYSQAALSQTCYKDIVEISLPSKVYATIGQEFNVYFDNIIRCDDLKNYQIDVGGLAKGSQLEECWRIVPDVAENLNLIISVYKNDTDLVASRTTTITAKANTAGTAKKAIFIGDSLTDAGTYTQELLNLKPNLTLLGTRGSGTNKHEGRAGWNTDDFVNKSTYNSMSNAFYNSTTSRFDFAYYMAQQSYSSTDYVCIELGINDMGRGLTVAQTIANLNTMIDSIKAYNSAIKIGIALTTPPAYSQDGWGRQNLSGTTRRGQKKRNFDLVKSMITTFEPRSAENIFVVPININLDTINNFPYEQKQVNARNTTLVSRCLENVHPATSGYMQIADSIYNWLNSFES
jgi:lysophospholipase L1-like esterase